jgi:7-carboxy-7-deazaguanine synthase
MKGLRLTELYSSVQGEGRRTGVITTFVRFGGCNMRCPGWPCDTQYAIEPSIWKNDPIVLPDELYESIVELPGHNVCITGGEPTMQPKEPLAELFDLLLNMNYTIDVFTNGSLSAFPLWITDPNVSVNLDWKLKGSGEQQHGVDIRLANARRLSGKDSVKFVITDDNDFDEALYLWMTMQKSVSAQFWVGVAWQKYDEAKLVQKVVDLDLPWRINTQVHKYIWMGAEKGV